MSDEVFIKVRRGNLMNVLEILEAVAIVGRKAGADSLTAPGRPMQPERVAWSFLAIHEAVRILDTSIKAGDARAEQQDDTEEGR